MCLTPTPVLTCWGHALQNPLLAKATVVDRSSGGAAAPSAAASATAANGAAAGVPEPPRQAEGSAAEGPQQQQPKLAVQPRQRRKVTPRRSMCRFAPRALRAFTPQLLPAPHLHSNWHFAAHCTSPAAR